MTTLYDTLGVPPTAPPEAIKRAYRKRAAETHPDKGGSAEAFSKVSGAWLVLRDPERRKAYDTDGTTDAPVDDRQTQIANMLCQLFSTLMDKAESVDHTDLVAQVRLQLQAMRKTNAANRKGIETGIAKIEKVIKRLKYKGKGANMILHALNQKLDGGQKARVANEREADHIAGALEEIDCYSYRVDEQESLPAGAWVRATTTSSRW